MSEHVIPYGRHDISQADIDAVIEVLRSDRLTQGPAVPAFEHAVAEKCGVAHAVAANSATSALHLACLALDVGPGDMVWTSPNTFVASANCARYCGAEVDFVDIDPHTWNLSVPKLREKLAQAKKDGRLPKVLVPVHFAGQPTEQETILDLAQEYGFRVLEDAAHAIGASRNGEPVGSCHWSDITVFSFHAVKIITTGEGGMALTNNGEVADRMRRLCTHGITRAPDKLTRPPDGPWYYEQIELGFNYRMTDIQAALGLSQLSRLDDFVRRRNELARRYDEAFAELPIDCQLVPNGVYSARHLYVIRVPAAMHRGLFEHLRAEGIGVNLHYIPVYWQPEYRRLGFKEGQCPEAERYYRGAISLPLYPKLRGEEQEQVIEACRRWFGTTQAGNRSEGRSRHGAGQTFR
jgi:UDP-4-amino-4,6-dideoxy-N-acetyl-beta-L-altrosamine transaminase